MRGWRWRRRQSGEEEAEEALAKLQGGTGFDLTSTDNVLFQYKNM